MKPSTNLPFFKKKFFRHKLVKNKSTQFGSELKDICVYLSKAYHLIASYEGGFASVCFSAKVLADMQFL